jgi:hypothetical protein
METRIQQQARKAAVMDVRRHAFENRRGTGRGPITKCVLTEQQLERQLHAAISRYEDYQKHFAKGSSS